MSTEVAGAPALVPTTGYWSGRAFGLELHSDFEVLGLQPAGPVALPGATVLRSVNEEAIDERWNPDEAERIVERRDRANAVFMAIDRHESAGFLISVPGYGRFIVRPDGERVDCSLPPGPAWRWHRLLFAQPLPIAAALTGLELFHASAVALDGRAVAIVGHSGAGKTSLAVHLASRGGALLTDDVLALEPRDDGVWAHPGAGMASVADEQLSAIAAGAGHSNLGAEFGRSDKVHVAVQLQKGPVPLDVVYFLQRGPQVSELAFEAMAPPDPRTLLAATFLRHVRTPRRLLGQLDACHRVAESARVFGLCVPEGIGAGALAEAVEAHALNGRPQTP